MYLFETEFSVQVLLATFNLNIPIRKFEAIHIRNAHTNGMKKKRKSHAKKVMYGFLNVFPYLNQNKTRQQIRRGLF